MELHPVNILIIDDSPEDRFSYKRMLNGPKGAGHYHFEECETAQECFSKDWNADCVILDYQLPDMDGLEMLKSLKSGKFKAVPVVMLTGQGDQQTAVEAMKLGADDYLVKNTLTPSSLERAIRNAIATKRLELDRERAQKALFESERSLRSIIDQALDAVVMMDDMGLITFMNPQAEKIFDIGQEDGIGKKFSEIIGVSSSPEIIFGILKNPTGPLEDTVFNRHFEVESIHPSGRELKLELALIPLRLESFQGIVCFLRDITERKRLEEQMIKANEELKRASEMKTEFTSIVSHELRTPLSIIKEGIELVLDEVDGPVGKENRETLEVTRNNINRLVRIVNNILDFNRIKSGKLRMSFDELDVGAFVSQIVNLMKSLIQAKNLKLTLDLPKSPLMAWADEDKLSQVFINLIDNAVKYTEEGGTIIVRAFGQDGEAHMSVSDSGPGIKRADYVKIFEMYGQSHNQMLFKTGGAGVGLAVCRSLMELHGGRIWVESEVGKGSTFSVAFPVTGPAESPNS